MTAFTIIPDSSIDADSVIDVALMTAMRDNLLSVAEGDASAPIKHNIKYLSSQSLSGSSIDFTIPSGVKHIVAGFYNMFVSAASADLLFRLGDAGGIETTGYRGGYCKTQSSNSTQSSPTDGWGFPVATGGNSHDGSLVLDLLDPSTNLWIGNGGSVKYVTYQVTTTGIKALSQELTTVRLTLSSGNFSSGTAYLGYSF